jgi:hypothetical protein
MRSCPVQILFTLFIPMHISQHLNKFCTFLVCMFPYYFIIFSLILLPAVMHFDFLVSMLCGTSIYLGSWFHKPVLYSVDEFVPTCYLCRICNMVSDLTSFNTDDIFPCLNENVELVTVFVCTHGWGNTLCDGYFGNCHSS